MNVFKKIGFFIFCITLFGMLIFLDIADRNEIHSRFISENETSLFHNYSSFEQKKKAYEKYFKNPEWNFPREKTDKIKIYKNKLFISRITAKTLSRNNESKLISFLNNPENFNWSETTWEISEVEYILRFYNSENQEIGKLWICKNDCWMLKSTSFSPNMKFGSLSDIGIIEMNEILENINNN